VICGSAANLFRDGADGLYLFNWHTYGPWRKPLLEELGNPAILRTMTKHYTLTHGIEATAFTPVTVAVHYNTALRDAVLPLTLSPTDSGKTIWIPVAEVPTSKIIRLRARGPRSDKPLRVSRVEFLAHSGDSPHGWVASDYWLPSQNPLF
jgi:hypothetical protein